MPPQAVTDGSSAQDSRGVVEIDPTHAPDRWRYTCPRGHKLGAISPTNEHLYCRNCCRQMEAGEDVSPEHHSLVDQQTGEEIPYHRVRFTD